MVKILHILSTMQLGGIESFLMNIIRNNSDSEIVNEILIFDKEHCYYEDEISSLGVKLIRSKSILEGHYSAFKQLKKFFKNNHFDVVHLHCSALPYYYCLKFAKKQGVMIRILHSHTSVSPVGNYYKFLHKFIDITKNSYITHKIACSNNAGKRMFKDDDFTIIKNGIDLNQYKKSIAKKKSIKEKLKLNQSTIIGHVGRLTEAKNHRFLLKIYEQYYAYDKDTLLLIVGDGELKNDIISQINKLNISGNVLMVGNTNHVEDYLQVMDLFVFPSIFEGLPLSLIEAQALELPIIVSDVIAKEVDVTESITFLSLSIPSSEWVKNMQLRLQNDSIIDVSKISAAGFDINNVIDVLNKIYKGVV
ncbi:MAG: glycosyltransferase [Bacilli bacterium]